MTKDNQLTYPTRVAQDVLAGLIARAGSLAAVAEAYSARYGLKQDSAERLLKRIRVGEFKVVTRDTLDKLCILADRHLDHYV